MASVRWRKLRGDLRTAWGRIAIMQLAVGLSLTGVGAVLATRTVLQREIAASFLATRPADATLELAEPVDAALLQMLRARGDLADVDGRDMIRARVKPRADAPWQMLVLFVAEDLSAQRIAVVRPESGAWPAAPGTLLLERTAPDVIGVDGGSPTVIVQTPHGTPTTMPVSGTVHDAAQAPAWQEHRGCAYISTATLSLLGEPPVLHQLLVRFSPEPTTTGEAEHRASELARSLRDAGHDVHEVRVPTLGTHPHQALMNAVQLVLLVFSALLFVLSTIVMATILSSILARQTREIGVMKAVGASTGQLAALYGTFIVAIAMTGVIIAIPLGAMGGGGMTRNIAGMMNIVLADPSIPGWVFVAVIGFGLVVPLGVAAVPIARATRVTVRRALADNGAGGAFAAPRLARIPLGVRNALRRPARLITTMLLLVVGGTFVITAANVRRGMDQVSSRIDVSRHFDVELRLHDTQPAARVAALARVAGVRTLEAWSTAPASIARAGEVAIVHTYPDGGHGSLSVTAPPAGGSTLVTLPLLEGRWLTASDDDAVVLGHNALHGSRPGDRVDITVDGTRTTLTVVGIVEEIGSGSAFVTASVFARTSGTGGVRLVRIDTTARSPADRAEILAALERTAATERIALDYAMPTPLLRSIIDDHLAMVTRAVIAMAAILALVGLFGLASAMAVGVAERTRELGIMKAIGATGGRVARIVLSEALAIGGASSLIAIALSFPLTVVVASRLSLIAATPFAVDPKVIIAWPLLVIAGSVVASLVPARRAARLSVKRALDHG